MNKRLSWLPFISTTKTRVLDIDVTATDEYGTTVRTTIGDRVRDFISRLRMDYKDQPEYMDVSVLGGGLPTSVIKEYRPHRVVEELMGLFNHYEYEVRSLENDVHYERERANVLVNMVEFLYGDRSSIVISEKDSQAAVDWCHENATGLWKDFVLTPNRVFIFENPDDAALFRMFKVK